MVETLLAKKKNNIKIGIAQTTLEEDDEDEDDE